MKRTRTYSPHAREALELLGTQIAAARRERRWTTRELSERAGISAFTLAKAERGDPTVAIGVVFELAILTGVPLFTVEQDRLAGELATARDRLALLPQRVRASVGEVKDDF